MICIEKERSELNAAPYAAALIESMRTVGYSPETAIADFVDNSISAGARYISIRYYGVCILEQFIPSMIHIVMGIQEEDWRQSCFSPIVIS